MKKYVLEACVDSVESACAAEAGGATRFELCGNLIIGGTTPSMELFRLVKEKTTIPIRVLIRPRFGDFLYSEFEYQIMLKEIKAFAKEGADGVVIGSLREDGSLNENQMKGMIEAAGECHITLHRAFDVCCDPFETLRMAKELGVDTILTSGQKASCYEGRRLIEELLDRAGDQIDILCGGGVTPQVIEKMIEIPGIRCFHMSGKETIDSGMKYRNEEVNMGLSGISEFSIWRTSEKNIQEAVQVLKKKFD